MIKKLTGVFLIGVFLAILVVFFPHLKLQQTWVSPAPKTEDILAKIEPKLQRHQNLFQLKRQFISSVSAGGDYERAPAYSVVDLSNGQVIASKNLSVRLPIASLTKVMTAVVALDLVSPDEEFSVSEKAAAQVPTKVMLKSGERFSLGNLLEYMLISSANDSAKVIQEGIDQRFGQDIFIKAMNRKAQILGLKNTNFTNAMGLDSSSHFSSVEDLSILSAYALKDYPLIASIVAKEFEDLTRGGQDKRFYLNNWNGLLGVYPGVSGVKTGNTGKADNCTIVVSERGGKKVLVVVLGAPGVLERDLWTSELLDLGFNKLAGLPPVNVTENQLRQKYASWKYL